MTPATPHRRQALRAPNLLADVELQLADGWRAGVAVDDDGALWPWLICPQSTESDAGTSLQAWPAHEQLGPLPWSFDRHFHEPRLAKATPEYVCGALTRAGKPCRSWVTASGERCWHHRPQAAAAQADL